MSDDPLRRAMDAARYQLPEIVSILPRFITLTMTNGKSWACNVAHVVEVYAPRDGAGTCIRMSSDEMDNHTVVVEEFPTVLGRLRGELPADPTRRSSRQP